MTASSSSAINKILIAENKQEQEKTALAKINSMHEHFVKYFKNSRCQYEFHTYLSIDTWKKDHLDTHHVTAVDSLPIQIRRFENELKSLENYLQHQQFKGSAITFAPEKPENTIKQIKAILNILHPAELLDIKHEIPIAQTNTEPRPSASPELSLSGNSSTTSSTRSESPNSQTSNKSESLDSDRSSPASPESVSIQFSKQRR